MNIPGDQLILNEIRKLNYKHRVKHENNPVVRVVMGEIPNIKMYICTEGILKAKQDPACKNSLLQ